MTSSIVLAGKSYFVTCACCRRVSRRVAPTADATADTAYKTAPAYATHFLRAECTVRPDLLQAWHQRLQPGQQAARSDPVLHIRRGDVDRERQAQSVYQEMALSVLDVLVGVVAALVSLVSLPARRFLCGLDALRIHDGRGRVGVFVGSLPLGRTQGFEDQKPQPAQAQSAEMINDRLPRREVTGQEPARDIRSSRRRRWRRRSRAKSERAACSAVWRLEGEPSATSTPHRRDR